MDSDHIVVLTTIGGRAEARTIAQAILRDGLAACVQLLPITSLYTWKGAPVEDDEVLLLIKTRDTRYQELEARIGELHPYEVPEIIALPVTGGLPAYLGWINDVTQATRR